jgi:hypothetical protein
MFMAVIHSNVFSHLSTQPSGDESRMKFLPHEQSLKLIDKFFSEILTLAIGMLY